MTEATIVVATFGQRKWVELAERRALPSAAKFGLPVVHEHGATLHDARNAGLAKVDTKWVCFLDADDELEPGYFEAMSGAAADVRVPAVRYVRPNGLSRQPPGIPQVAGHHHLCDAECLPYGNWIVIGAVAKTELVRQVGGFRDWSCIEDWDLWARCYQAGASFARCPDAVYRAHVRPDSRNRLARGTRMLETHREIAAELGFPIP